MRQAPAVLALVVTALSGSGCAPATPEPAPGDAGEGAADDPSGDASEASGSEESGEAGSPFPGREPCEVTEDCRDGFCVGIWDAGTGTCLRPPSCQAQCVEAGDPDAVCVDDAGCCDVDASCDARGVCVLDSGEGTETSGGEP